MTSQCGNCKHQWVNFTGCLQLTTNIIYTTLDGGAENDGHENDGPSKCPGMKLTDMKMMDMKLTDTKMQDVSGV